MSKKYQSTTTILKQKKERTYVVIAKQRPFQCKQKLKTHVCTCGVFAIMAPPYSIFFARNIFRIPSLSQYSVYVFLSTLRAAKKRATWSHKNQWSFFHSTKRSQHCSGSMAGAPLPKLFVHSLTHKDVWLVQKLLAPATDHKKKCIWTTSSTIQRAEAICAKCQK